MPDFGSFRGFGEKLTQGQTPTQLGKIGSESAFDGDANNYFLRVASAGGSLSNTEKVAVNQLVLDLKANSLWTYMKAIYPMVGASAAACAQNLKSSSFTGTFTSGWTFASTGVTPNGTSAYMDTGFIETGNVTLGNQHISFYSRTNIDGLYVDFGCQLGGDTQLIPNYTGILYPRLHGGGGQVSGLNLNTAAYFILNRKNTSQVVAFRNTTKYTTTATASSLNTSPLLLSATRFSGASNYNSVRQCAFASIGDGLTDTEASNFYTCVQTFNTTLSRQV